MTLTIARHAESNGNATGDYSTATHDSLSPKGREQSARLAHALNGYHFTRVCVSPLTRALETAAPFLALWGRMAEVWPELAEGCWQQRDSGAAESWPSEPSDIPAAMSSLLAFRDGLGVRPSWTETFAQGMCRVRRASALLTGLVARQGQNVLIVTHGHFIRELLNVLLQTRSVQEFPHDNCALTRLTFSGGWKLDFTNRSTQGS